MPISNVTSGRADTRHGETITTRSCMMDLMPLQESTLEWGIEGATDLQLHCRVGLDILLYSGHERLLLWPGDLEDVVLPKADHRDEARPRLHRYPHKPLQPRARSQAACSHASNSV